MIKAGVSPVTVRKVLENIGFSKEKIDSVIQTISHEMKTSEEECDLLSLQEELEKQKAIISCLQDEIKKINSNLSKLVELSLVKKEANEESLESRVTALEAKVEGLIDAIGEYVPELMKKFRNKP